jgi:hypothetical protein
MFAGLGYVLAGWFFSLLAVIITSITTIWLSRTSRDFVPFWLVLGCAASSYLQLHFQLISVFPFIILISLFGLIAFVWAVVCLVIARHQRKH